MICEVVRGCRGQPTDVGENSCFPPYPFSALLALNGAFAPSVGLCPTPRFLLEAKRKRKAILLRKGEKRISPLNYNLPNSLPPLD